MNLVKFIHEMESQAQLRRSAEMAWERFDNLHDEWLLQLGDRTKPITVSEGTVEAAEAMAIHLQQAYFQKYYELNSDQCSCNPNTAIACDVCQAQIKAKSTYREEM